MSLDSQHKIVLSDKEEAFGRFNLYRVQPDQMVLQAMNGRYLSVQPDKTLTADQEKEAGTVFTVLIDKAGVVSFFCKSDNNSRFFICEIDNAVLMYEVKEGENPPPGAGFTELSLAPGLDEIQQTGAAGKDLDWADLKGAGMLPAVKFEGCSARFADLSGLTLNQADFANSKLEQIKLKDAMLQNANFTSSDLTGANLTNANGKGAVFTKATLDQCALKWFIGDKGSYAGASMIQTDCYQAFFNSADFKRAVLRNSNLFNINWPGCDLAEADLSGANVAESSFRNVTMDGSTVFTGARLTKCNFREMKLTGIHLSHCDLQGAYFDKADLTGADLSYSNLKDAHLTNTILIGATLVNSYLQDADFTKAQLGYSFHQNACDELSSQNAADLTGAYMPNAVFNEANMNGINMTGVSWYGFGAEAIGAYMHQINFSEANLGSMKFDQADLRGSTFDYANLIGCSFKKAVLRPSDNLRRVSFAHANIQGADFFESEMEDVVFSNAGVAMPVEWNFAVTGEKTSVYRAELNRDGIAVSGALRDEFTTRGLAIPGDAVSRVWAMGYKWDIISDVNPDAAVYELTMENGRLEVRSGPDGVPLLRCRDQTGVIKKGLDEGLIIQELSELMKEAGYPLKSIASVSDITKGRKWGIDNDLKDGRTLQRGYLEFYITPDQDGMLTVYGTILGTIREGEGGIWEQVHHIMASTRWVPDLLKGDSICPSGHKIQVVNNPRPEISMTWKEAVTADTLPREPECIPNPYTWCSPERGCSIKCIK